MEETGSKNEQVSPPPTLSFGGLPAVHTVMVTIKVAVRCARA